MRLRVHLIKGPLEVQERKEKWGKQKLGYVVPAHNCCKLFIFVQQAGVKYSSGGKDHEGKHPPDENIHLHDVKEVN